MFQYKNLNFFAKGNGNYTVQIETSSVTDYNYHQSRFIAPRKGETFSFPLANFKQQNWGKRVEFSGKDVKNIVWLSTDSTGNPQLDLFIGNVSFT
ncbi:MAG: hypothetical protein HGA25_02655 [Clostridiales bacterium]|nr:hypothetical protein [Clostridiales bacterium]